MHKDLFEIEQHCSSERRLNELEVSGNGFQFSVAGRGGYPRLYINMDCDIAKIHS